MILAAVRYMMLKFRGGEIIENAFEQTNFTGLNMGPDLIYKTVDFRQMWGRELDGEGGGWGERGNAG